MTSRFPVGTLLAGRQILVTGGANGIGAAVVDRFASMGAGGLVLDLPAPAETARSGPWRQVNVDVTDEVSVAEGIGAAADILGHVDGVVAAAGIVPPWSEPTTQDLAEWDRVFAVNVRGVIAVIKHVALLMEAGSTITVVGSLNSWRGDPNITSYAASKHAVLGIVRSAAMALGPKGIRVNAVAPGPIATDALLTRMRSRAAVTGLSVDEALTRAAAATSLRRLATEDDVADTVAFFTSPLSNGITGQLLPVDGGIG